MAYIDKLETQINIVLQACLRGESLEEARRLSKLPLEEVDRLYKSFEKDKEAK